MAEYQEFLGGRVKLYRGDSVAMLQAGELQGFDAIVTDPPYGISFQHRGGGDKRLSGGVKSNTSPIYGDDKPFDPAPWIEAAPRTMAKPCAGNTIIAEPRIILFGADHFKTRLPEGGTLLAWDKHIGVGADDSFADCEWMWCGRKARREVFRHLWKGVVRATERDDRCHEKGTSTRAHVSQKPVALMRWCIEKIRPPQGGTVLDPYMGSGTTGIAATSLGYGFIGVEYAQEHFDVACQRIEAHIERGEYGG